MAIQAQTNVTVTIPTGPTFSIPYNISADSYSRATVSIANGLTAGKPGTTLELQPGAGTALLLAMTSTDYSGNVTYQFGGTAWKLDGPQVILGSSLTGALSLAQTIVFDTSNAGVTAPVTVDVLVLRKALV